MPVRVNQRAVEARERKAAAAAAKAAAAEQEAERKRWEDNDKLVSRKLDRKVQYVLTPFLHKHGGTLMRAVFKSVYVVLMSR
ncbi:hypothetical protein Emag_003691 [Eimeria magna]